MDALKKILGFLGTLFFGMHFWLPLVYTIVFVVFSAASGTILENWGFYFLGLSVSLAGSVALVYRGRARASAGDEDKTEAGEEKKKIVYVVPPESEKENGSQTIIIEKNPQNGNRPEIAPEVDIRKEVDTAMSSQSARPSDVSGFGYSAPGGQRFEPAPPREKPSYYEEAEKLAPVDDQRQKDRISENDLYSGFSGYLSPHEPIPERKDQVFAAEQKPVQPKVYRTRTDPSVIIYDYPDRTERYRIMQDGSLSLISADRKQG